MYEKGGAGEGRQSDERPRYRQYVKIEIESHRRDSLSDSKMRNRQPVQVRCCVRVGKSQSKSALGESEGNWVRTRRECAGESERNWVRARVSSTARESATPLHLVERCLICG